MDPGIDPGVPLTRVNRPPSQWLAVVAVGVIAAVTLAFVKPWEDPAARATSSLAAVAPSAAVASTLAPTPQPIVWSPLDRHAWLLDFERSGLSPIVCLGYDGTTCESEGALGSSIRFQDDRVSGGTGVGGGCDQFSGSLEHPDHDPGSIRITIPSYESRCYDTGVDREIRDRLNRVARWDPMVDGTENEPLLILLDVDGNQVLVYRR